MSVAAKLKKFHTVVQQVGGVRLGLRDVLIKPGQSASELVDQDAKQIEGLTAAAAAARSAAVAAIGGRPLEANSSGSKQEAVAASDAVSGVKKGFLGRQISVPAAASSEIQAADETGDTGAPGNLLWARWQPGIQWISSSVGGAVA